MNKKLLGLSLAAAFSVSTAQAALIDDFNGGNVNIPADSAGVNTAYVNAIGGSRTVSITKTGPLGAASDVIGGVYAHSAGALTSATSVITWNANGAGLGGGAGVDLVEGLINNVFSFSILGIDQGNLDLILSVSDTSSALNTSFTFSNAMLGLQTVAFANFGGIDFTMVDFLSLEVKGSNASDLTLDLLETTGERPPVINDVPEPASLALLGLGLAAFGFGRRKSI